MSGTSMDGIDAALVQIQNSQISLLTHVQLAYPEHVLKSLRQISVPGQNEIDRMGKLDLEVATAFAQATQRLLDQAGINSNQITAIGSHGQTIRHRPQPHNASNDQRGFTLQIGDPNTMAVLTGIPVVADFRRKDMALGGQGAPLAPGFHVAAFDKPEQSQVVLNLGGIANITHMPAVAANTATKVIGFDTGPANTLLDAWYQKHHSGSFDEDGNWAQTGKVDRPLLARLLKDPYFAQTAPKSTGREYFSLAWLNSILANFNNLNPPDIQHTLVEFTVETIGEQIDKLGVVDNIFVCGGGALNAFLMTKLQQRMGDTLVSSTAVNGIDPTHVESMAFAWLASQRLNNLAGNIPSVTGASQRTVLGAIYLPN